MAAAIAGRSPADGRRESAGAGSFRFGAVFVLTLALCVFLIVAPDADWARSVALALLSAALVVVMATSRASAAVRRARAVTAGCAAVAVLIAVAAGVLPTWLVYVVGVALSLAIPIMIVGGLIRLTREHGVTLQTVAGALTIYVLLGLVFAWIYAFADQLDPGPFFVGDTETTQGSRVYFSFTALTTTGFGDLAAATPPGRALVLLEMLIGQLYLVTVIGVLVGSFGRR
jgi:predicted membrane channel-forming protein YqfA (hemolysin III family)